MAELSVINPKLMTIAELKEWLSSKGAPTKGKKSELVERVHACLKYGWTKAGNEISTMEKRDAIKYPESGWVPLVSAFSQWEPRHNEPHFSMASIMAYFISRITEDSLPASDFKSSSRLAENLFRCGHIQSIEVAIIPELSNCLFLRSKCLPEMRKDRVYIVCMHLNRTKFDIINAECGCPAGKGPFGSCKHIGALAYALADFFRFKSELHLTSTDQLQKWNQPRSQKLIQYLLTS